MGRECASSSFGVIACRLVVAAATLSCADALRAQPPQPPPQIPEGYEMATHIVRKGDTLIGITQKYLGDGGRWRLNYRLNPGVVVRKLNPGARLKVLVRPGEDNGAARIVQRAGDVDALPRPLEWIPAEIDDLLVARDGTRTSSQSSAEINLPNGGSLILGEESLVYLRMEGGRLQAVEDRAVELMQGQADIDLSAFADIPRPKVDLILGQDRVRMPDVGEVKTRAVREQSQSKLSVYQGEVRLDSSVGGEVELGEGEGLVVEDGQPPPLPEKLLEAPTPVQPRGGAEWYDFRPLTLEWEAPRGSPPEYTGEICIDPDCGQLVRRATGIPGTTWRPGPLPLGSYFWRVTARAVSGLDGYPSAAQAFTLTQPTETAPPVARLELVGSRLQRGGTIVVGAPPELLIEAIDDDSGVFAQRLVANGVEREIGAPWPPGPYTVKLVVEDHAGNLGESKEISFVVKEPPVLAMSSRATEPSKRAAEGEPRPRVEWSLAPGVWRPLGVRPIDVMSVPYRISLRPFRGHCLLSDSGERWCDQSALVFEASDSVLGIERISTRLEHDRDDISVAVWARDVLGQESRRVFLVETPP